MIRSILLFIFVAFLSGCASLTGARSCTCEHNAKTGLTKWSCESGAMSEAAKLRFDSFCGFEASAQGAQQGQPIINAQFLGAALRSLLTGQMQLQDQSGKTLVIPPAAPGTNPFLPQNRPNGQ